MLSVHYVSIMMRIFYIDLQQHWGCDRTMIIGANAHGKRTVSTKQPQVTDLTSVSPLTVGLPMTSERHWSSFQVTRLFHSATIILLLHVCLLFKTSQGSLPGWRGFFYLDLVGEHSAPMYIPFAPYTDPEGRQGYFGVSNVTLVFIILVKNHKCTLLLLNVP